MKAVMSSVVLVILVTVAAFAAPETWTGQISDSMCGAKHASMGGNKMSDQECTEMCVKGGGKYVFAMSGKVFQIVNQKDAALARHAGHTVLLTGVRKGDTITVSKIEMPKVEKK